MCVCVWHFLISDIGGASDLVHRFAISARGLMLHQYLSCSPAAIIFHKAE